MFQMENNKSGITCLRCRNRIQKGQWFTTTAGGEFCHMRRRTDPDFDPCTGEVDATSDDVESREIRVTGEVAVAEEAITLDEQQA